MARIYNLWSSAPTASNSSAVHSTASMGRLSRDRDIVPRRCPILQVAMAYLTVRGKTLRGWVRDGPVSA
jgi:hypothetical protein